MPKLVLLSHRKPEDRLRRFVYHQLTRFAEDLFQKRIGPRGAGRRLRRFKRAATRRRARSH